MNGLPLEARLAVERHAMERAEEFLRALGYSVEDVSRTKPYDLLAEKNGVALTVEVKGTTTGAESVLLTRNEVDHARENPTQAVLYILHTVRIDAPGGKPKASGGQAEVHWPWSIDPGDLEPLQFKYTPGEPNYPTA